MSNLVLAANAIPLPWPFDSWGHLQIVYQGREIEVQAPTVPYLQGFNYPSIGLR